MDLGGWLRSLDLEEYEAAFHKNHIDEVVLPNLTAEDLGARDLKGIAEPVRAWAALRASSFEGRFDALHGIGLTALVGRRRTRTSASTLVITIREGPIGRSTQAATSVHPISVREVRAPRKVWLLRLGVHRAGQPRGRMARP